MEVTWGGNLKLFFVIMLEITSNFKGWQKKALLYTGRSSEWLGLFVKVGSALNVSKQ